MEAGYFIIAILGCGDGGVGCQTVATPAAHYASEQACLAARGDALMANSDLDFPTLFATCQPVARKASAGEPVTQPRDSAAAWPLCPEADSPAGQFRGGLVGNVAEITNWLARSPNSALLRIATCIDFARQFRFGTLPALVKASSHWGVQKGVQPMLVSFSPVRQIAVSFAGALIASLLFVSAAVGPLPFVAWTFDKKEQTMEGRFLINRRDAKIMGVAAGLADYTGVDPLVVRLGFVAAVLIAGPVAILFYLLTGWLASERWAPIARRQAR
jgi:phage shock protein C